MQHYPPIRSDDDSGTSTDVSDVFSYDATSESSGSASEPDSVNDSDDNSSDDSILDYEERELPAEYYLQEAECLDVSRLRQKRYSPRTQDKLDETREYWDR